MEATPPFRVRFTARDEHPSQEQTLKHLLWMLGCLKDDFLLREGVVIDQRPRREVPISARSARWIGFIAGAGMAFSVFPYRKLGEVTWYTHVSDKDRATLSEMPGWCPFFSHYKGLLETPHFGSPFLYELRAEVSALRREVCEERNPLTVESAPALAGVCMGFAWAYGYETRAEYEKQAHLINGCRTSAA